MKSLEHFTQLAEERQLKHCKFIVLIPFGEKGLNLKKSIEKKQGRSQAKK